MCSASSLNFGIVLTRYCDDEFDPESSTATIGIDFKVCRICARARFCEGEHELLSAMGSSRDLRAAEIAFISCLKCQHDFKPKQPGYLHPIANPTQIKKLAVRGKAFRLTL